MNSPTSIDPDDYEHEAEKAIARAVELLLLARGTDETVNGDYVGDSVETVLFVVLVRTAKMYLEHWASLPRDGALANFVVDADDTEDPSRISNPEDARLRTLQDLMLEAVDENLDSIFGRDE